MILFAFVLFFTDSIAQSSPQKVPTIKASSVMIDGRFEDAEWFKAQRVVMSDSVNFYIMQDKENIYWCLRGLFKKPTLGGVDFYMLVDNNLINFHASAQLGERKLSGNDYGEWTWWNNERWVANVVRIDKLAERKFHMDEAKEFQLRKSRFDTTTIKIMVEVSHPKQLGFKFPAAATPTATTNWLELKL